MPLLDTLDIAGAVITADALHTAQAYARYLLKRRAFYVDTVKENTPALFDTIDALAWAAEPAGEPIAAGRHWAASDYRNPLSLLGLTM